MVSPSGSLKTLLKSIMVFSASSLTVTSLIGLLTTGKSSTELTVKLLSTVSLLANPVRVIKASPD